MVETVGEGINKMVGWLVEHNSWLNKLAEKK